MTDDELQNNYPLTQWVDDFGDLYESGAMVGNLSELVQGHFLRGYPDSPLALEQAARIEAALLFVKMHSQELEDGHALVLGKFGSLVTIELMTALYRIFLPMPREWLGREVSVEWVLRLTREQKKLNSGD